MATDKIESTPQMEQQSSASQGLRSEALSLMGSQPGRLTAGGGAPDELEFSDIYASQVKPASARNGAEDMEHYQNVKEQAENSQDYKTGEQVQQWAANEENFRRVDADGDGYMSKDEIATAMSKTEDRAERELLGKMYEKAAEISGASNDEWGFETTGISRADIAAYPQSVVDKALFDEAAVEHILNWEPSF